MYMLPGELAVTVYKKTETGNIGDQVFSGRMRDWVSWMYEEIGGSKTSTGGAEPEPAPEPITRRLRTEFDVTHNYIIRVNGVDEYSDQELFQLYQGDHVQIYQLLQGSEFAGSRAVFTLNIDGRQYIAETDAESDVDIFVGEGYSIVESLKVYSGKLKDWKQR